MNIKLSTYLFLLLISSSLYSQSITKIGNQWNVTDFPTFLPIWSTKAYKILNTRVIDNKVYAEIYETKDSLYRSWNKANIFIREDSTKKVYIKRGTSNEQLFCDFGMKVLDTIKQNTFESTPFVLRKIDTIKLLNGEIKRRLIFSSRNTVPEEGSIIEGIGSLHGFDFTLIPNWIDINRHLVCFSQNDKLIYSSQSTCFFENSQSPFFYTSIMHPGNRWHTSSKLTSNSPPMNKAFKTGRFKTFDNQNYIQLDMAIDASASKWDTTDLYIKELQGKVYLKENTKPEKLLYDFNLKLNDTISILDKNNNVVKLKVIKVDYITLPHGNIKKRIRVTDDKLGLQEKYWIQDVGSYEGLLDNYPSLSADAPSINLNCFYHKDQLLYTNTNGKCFLTNTNELSQDDNIKIYPNPSSDYINIEDPELKIQSIFIYTLTGKQVRKYDQSIESKIDVTTLNAGLYLLKITNKVGETYSYRLMKQ
jgi:hypothetical protein